MSLSVFNKDNKSHLEAETPLHFGERLGIHDTINIRHQYIEDLFQYLKSIDWNEKEVDLTRYSFALGLLLEHHALLDTHLQ